MKIEIENFRKYLSGICQMDKDSFEEALDYLKIENISKGDFLIRGGQICRKIAFIYSGLFRVFNLKDGIEVNTCFCMENSMTCTFSSIVNQIPTTENIQALEDSVVVTISAESCNELSDKNKQWQVIRRLLTENECVRLSERANFLSFESAMEKYQNLLRLQPQLIQRVSIQHLASYIGISRETLSRIRSKIA